MKREWIAPGVLLAVLTLGANLVSAWAVDRYRQDGTEKAIEGLRVDIKNQGEETDQKFEKNNDRLDKMGQGAQEVIRLQERNAQLTDAISELRVDMREGFEASETRDEVIQMQAQKFREETQRELYRKGVS